MQKGGYLLSDKSEGFLYDTLKNHLETYEDFFLKAIRQGNGDLDKVIREFEKTDYTLIYLHIIMNNYMQRDMYVQNLDNSYMDNIIPYHINIAALIFISFLTEFELFTLVYTTIQYNTEKQQNNYLKSIFYMHLDKTTPSRIFKEKLKTMNLIDILNDFTDTLDEQFKTFMISLIEKLSYNLNTTRLFIYKLIVSDINNESYKDNNYTNIFANWKDKIKELYASEQHNKIDIEINNAIKDAMQKIQTQNLIFNAEGTGFFGYIFMQYKDGRHNYGSCITYSLFEIYIMTRLFINGKNINLRIEKTQQQVHPYWTNTRNGLDSINVTHWATNYKLTSATFNLRSVSEPLKLYNLCTDLKYIFKAFIYPIYDSYNIYTNSLQNHTASTKISRFIKNRISLFDDILKTQEAAQKPSYSNAILMCNEKYQEKWIELWNNLIIKLTNIAATYSIDDFMHLSNQIPKEFIEEENPKLNNEPTLINTYYLVYAYKPRRIFEFFTRYNHSFLVLNSLLDNVKFTDCNDFEMFVIIIYALYINKVGKNQYINEILKVIEKDTILRERLTNLNVDDNIKNWIDNLQVYISQVYISQLDFLNEIKQKKKINILDYFPTFIGNPKNKIILDTYSSTINTIIMVSMESINTSNKHKIHMISDKSLNIDGCNRKIYVMNKSDINLLNKKKVYYSIKKITRQQIRTLTIEQIKTIIKENFQFKDA